MPGQTESYWIDSAPDLDFPSQEGDVEVDVAVIGGGIVGITSAFLLKQAGKKVALVEARQLARGATGYTTAKLTSSHSLIYKELADSFGLEGARTYGRANEGALERIAALVEDRNIDCGFERMPNFVYTQQESEVQSLKEEADAARSAGLPASFVTDSPLPLPIKAAVRFENQAQFHPRKFLHSLALDVAGDGGHVFVETKAIDLSEGQPCTVTTNHGAIRARAVIVATHLPVFDRGLFFAKAYPYNSYAVAGIDPENRSLDGMYISTGDSTYSIRTIPDEGRRLLLIGGNGHHVGGDSANEARYDKLMEFGSRWFGVDDWPHRWSTHDYLSVDRVPFVGRFTRGSDHVRVATGFGKWGMCNGVAAAMMLSDEILGRSNPWAALFDAKRINLSGTSKFVTENTKVGAHFFLGRVPTLTSAGDIRPGHGGIVSDGLKKVAAYRDETGVLHACSAVCTHLRCIVTWNPADQTFDCPCHGSRYDRYGKVVNGPATKDLWDVTLEEG